MKRKNKRGRFLPLVRDVILVSLGRYGQYVVTLATVPLCARILGIEGTGMLAIATAAYFFGSILVDFGLSQILASRLGQGESADSIRGAYFQLRILVLLSLMVLFVLFVLLDAPPHALMIGVGLLAGGLSSMGEEWVLLGYGEFGRIAIFQVTGRVAYLGSLFLVLPSVRQPWVPMVCLALSTIISALLSWARVGWIRKPESSKISVCNLVTAGAPSIGARLLTAGYSQSSAIYYSAIVPIGHLGVFSAGDKLVRASSSALDALGIALLPRMSGSTKRPAEFWENAKRGGVGAFVLGVVLAALLWFAAPVAISVLYGPQFEAAIPILRWLSLLIPATAVSSMIMTSVLYVREDSKGILLGAACGIAAGGAGFIATWIAGGSLTTMVAALVILEWVVAFFYVVRFLMLRKVSLRKTGPIAYSDIHSISGK